MVTTLMTCSGRTQANPSAPGHRASATTQRTGPWATRAAQPGSHKIPQRCPDCGQRFCICPDKSGKPQVARTRGFLRSAVSLYVAM